MRFTIPLFFLATLFTAATPVAVSEAEEVAQPAVLEARYITSLFTTTAKRMRQANRPAQQLRFPRG